jgi:Ca-activated chloride channel family protein
MHAHPSSSTHLRWSASAALVAIAVAIMAAGSVAGQQQPPPQKAEDSFKFRSGVELVNVTATVTDASGRFVPGLRKEDFLVYEDGKQVPISNFSNERVPVSLGIVLDTSSSMAGEKFAAAQSALDRLVYDLLDNADEIFLYRFSGDPDLVQNWTTDRSLLRRALNRMIPAGGTAMYDAVAEAVPLAQTGKNRKKALVIISDGNDTSSRTDIVSLKQLIRETEVLVYAIGIDSQNTYSYFPAAMSQRRQPPRLPIPLPFPIPGGGRRNPPPSPPPSWPPSNPRSGRNANEDRVNVLALREITDDSGGRTEIVRTARDLDPATSGIADELSRQYYLGYPSTGVKDGRWHTIRVDLRNPTYRVRARRGFVATP